MPTPPSDRLALARRAHRFLTHWDLRTDGPPLSGIAADGTPAALKLQHMEEECADEAAALPTRAEDSAVRLLAPSGTWLLDRLHEHRPLAALPDTREAAALLDEPLVIPPHPDCPEWVTGHAE